MTKRIGLIVGSLRKASWNRKVAETVQTLFPEGYEAEFIEIADLPFYNEEYDEEVANTPESYKVFREAVKSHDAFIFFTPEYNRSFPATLKNALDVASRPYGQNAWDGKVAGIASATIGTTGAMAANLALRQVFVFLNLIPVQQPEVYLSQADSYFKDGEMVEDTKQFLQGFVDTFVKTVEQQSK